ncbi:MAG: DNA primase [Candidatus Saccharibacteria bacterium]|nr:DNA primase [Candidatus Saccharibacteria bacterium]
MQDAKDEIKARLPVEDVVGQYIELKRAGRNWKGRSPWGVDKTPSFMVSPDKGIWHDFSANKGGDIFTFVMEVEGISFREAMEKLAAQAGVELTKYDGGDKKVAEKKARAREALELATKFYQVCLTRNKQVMEYVFRKRGMNKETVKEFRIGYSPSGKSALKDFLLKKGFKQEDLETAGLLNQYGGDMFRGRMMVPFFEPSTGDIIGYTARILADGEPKYLNTSDTILFNKGRFIFGLRQAKEAIRRSGYVVIVEGNMDVISSHQAGVKEAVATSGTAMTENHLKILARLTDDIRLAYDGDAAGVKATERAIELAGGIGISLSVISGYNGAKDPDELIQKSPKAWKECVEQREPAIDWILKKYESQCDLETGPGKKKYSDEAMKIIRMIPDAVEQRHYEQKVARRLDVSVEDLRAKKIPKSGVKTRLKPIKTDGKTVSETAKIKSLEDQLQAILLYGGGAGNGIKLELPEDETRLAELELIFEEKFGAMPETELKKVAVEINQRYEQERKQVKINELTKQLEECSDDEEKTEEILREITRLRKNVV